MIIHILANSQNNLQKAFCWNGKPETRWGVLTPQIAEQWKSASLAKAVYVLKTIQLFWAEREIFWQNYQVMLPVHDWSSYKIKKDITVIENSELSRLAVAWVISDAMWLLIKAVLRFYNFVSIDWWEYFEPREEVSNKHYVSKFEAVDLKHLTRVEVAQWFTSRSIWVAEHDWAYTHSVRARMMFNPYVWQYNVLVNWKRLNFIAWTRRSWKTLASSYIAGRHLFKDRVLTSRPVQVLYIAMTKPKMLQPFTYLETALQSAVEAWIVSIYKNEHNYKIVNNMNGNFIQFVSADSKWWVISFAADLIIMDEAARIHENVWLDILPIIEQDQAELYAISTINFETRKNWFYEELVKGEMWYDDELRSTRVTIDDVEAFTEIAKDRLKDRLKKFPQRYFAELYSVYPNTSDVFSLEWFFRWYNNELTVTHDTSYIIGYDPAKETDQWGVLIFNCKEKRFEKEKALIFTQYLDQVSYIIALKKEYNNAFIVMDVTWVGKAVEEMFWWLLSCKIYSNRNIAVNNYNEETQEWRIAKKDLVNNMSAILEMQWVHADAKLVELKRQLEWFKAVASNTGNVIYEWDGVPDDLISAAYIILWFWWVINGELHSLIKNEKADDWTTSWFQWYESQFQTEAEDTKVSTRIKNFIY